MSLAADGQVKGYKLSEYNSPWDLASRDTQSEERARFEILPATAASDGQSQELL